mgnify:CR=1 FL=1
MNKLQKLIYEKLTENTGKHFLDSGGSNNRHWQRNQEKTFDDFMNEQEQVYGVGFNNEGKADELFRTVSVFHYLAGDGSNLELDKISKEFNKLNELNDELADCEPYGVGVSAWDYLSEFVDEDYNIHTWNTFNGNSDLSQTLQGATLRLFVDGQYEDYVLIQIHGGCDVRGGYTDAILFKCEYGLINEYLMPYMDSYDIEQELEYIDQLHDWFDHGKVYEGEKLETIKQQLIN